MLNNEKFVVTECLKTLGLDVLALEAHKTQNGEVLKNLAHIAEKTAREIPDTSIIERLQFAGLIY